MILRILTCNLRTSREDDSGNDWVHRKNACEAILRSNEPSIMCFQELSLTKLQDLKTLFEDFDHAGLADTPHGKSPVNAIFFQKDLLDVVTTGGFWLSENPHVAGSKSWGSIYPRVANWIRLQDNTVEHKEFRIINTHLDHDAEVTRTNQAKLVLEDACAYGDSYPQILTGDLNCDASSEVVRILEASGFIDTYETVHGTKYSGHTHHAFAGDAYATPIGKIDWIFARGAVEVAASQIIKDTWRGRFPSDHYFVSATLRV